MPNIDADALIERFTARNKDELEKVVLKMENNTYQAVVSLKLLAKSAAEAEDILKTLCSNLEQFSDIAKADGEVL